MKKIIIGAALLLSLVILPKSASASLLSDFVNWVIPSSTTSTSGLVTRIGLHTPATRTANISTTQITSDHVLGDFDIKLQGQSGTVDAINFSINIATPNTLPDDYINLPTAINFNGNPANSTVAVKNALQNIRLYSGSNLLANASALSSSNPATVTFNNISLPLTADQWNTLTLKADVLPTQTPFIIRATLIGSSIVGVDSNSQLINLSGAANRTANNVIFSPNAGATLTSHGFTKRTPSQLNTRGQWITSYPTYTFTINNGGNNPIYISKTANIALATSTSAGPAASTSVVGNMIVAGGSATGDTSTSYVINNSRTFTVDFTTDNTNFTQSSKRLSITQINYGTAGTRGADNTLNIKYDLENANVNFTDDGGTVMKGIKIISPVSSPGETTKLYSGSKYTIKWSTSSTIKRVKLSLNSYDEFGNPTPSVAMGDFPNTGFYEWMVPEPQPNKYGDTDYTLTISSGDNDISPSQDSSFFEIIPLNKPYIKVITPNGGETVSKGAFIDIKWTSQGLPPDSYVEFSLLPKSGSNVSLIEKKPSDPSCYSNDYNKIACPPLATGSYRIKIPDYLFGPEYTKGELDYKLMIQCVTPTSNNCIQNNPVRDSSDNYFTLSTGSTDGDALCPPGYTCYPPNVNPVCSVGYICTPVTSGCPTGYSCYKERRDPNVTSSISILSPNAGDNITYGKSFDIKIKYNIDHNSSSLRLSLYNNAGQVVYSSTPFTALATTDTDKNYISLATGAFTPEKLPAGAYYVTICDDVSPGEKVCAKSSTFNIVNGNTTNPSSSNEPIINMTWNGGTTKVNIGLIDSKFERDRTVLGWLMLDQRTTGSFKWNGQSITDLAGTVAWRPLSLSSGPFRIVAVTAGPTGNYCVGSNSECKYVISNSFTIAPNANYNLTLPTFSSSPQSTPSPAASISPLAASCRGYASSSTSNITWNASAAGGVGPYRYAWSIYNDVAGYGEGSTQSSGVMVRYGAGGTKEAVIRVSDSNNTTVTASCSINLILTPNTPPAPSTIPTPAPSTAPSTTPYVPPVTAPAPSTSPAGDVSLPSMPSNLTASAVSTSRINLSWSPSSDNVGIGGYRVYRNASYIGTASGTSYYDTGLSANTTYKYTVSAYDTSGNNSEGTNVYAQTLANTSTSPSSSASPSPSSSSSPMGQNTFKGTSLVASMFYSLGDLFDSMSSGR